MPTDDDKRTVDDPEAGVAGAEAGENVLGEAPSDDDDSDALIVKTGLLDLSDSHDRNDHGDDDNDYEGPKPPDGAVGLADKKVDATPTAVLYDARVTVRSVVSCERDSEGIDNKTEEDKSENFGGVDFNEDRQAAAAAGAELELEAEKEEEEEEDRETAAASSSASAAATGGGTYVRSSSNNEEKKEEIDDDDDIVEEALQQQRMQSSSPRETLRYEQQTPFTAADDDFVLSYLRSKGLDAAASDLSAILSSSQTTATSSANGAGAGASSIAAAAAAEVQSRAAEGRQSCEAVQRQQDVSEAASDTSNNGLDWDALEGLRDLDSGAEGGDAPTTSTAPPRSTNAAEEDENDGGGKPPARPDNGAEDANEEDKKPSVTNLDEQMANRAETERAKLRSNDGTATATADATEQDRSASNTAERIIENEGPSSTLRSAGPPATGPGTAGAVQEVAAAASTAAAGAAQTRSGGDGNDPNPDDDVLFKRFFGNIGRFVAGRAAVRNLRSSTSNDPRTPRGILRTTTRPRAAQYEGEEGVMPLNDLDTNGNATDENGQSQPGAFQVDVPATVGPIGGRRFSRRNYRRRMNNRRRRGRSSNRRLSPQMDDIYEDIESEIAENDSLSNPIDELESLSDLEAEVAAQQPRSRSSPAAPVGPPPPGSVLTPATAAVVTTGAVAVEATAVDDDVVEASILEKGYEERGWSRRRKVGTGLAVLIMIAAIIGIIVTQTKDTSSAKGPVLPVDIATILAQGEGEVCVASDPTACSCYTGKDYVGFINTTATGIPCQRWDSQFPQQHGFLKSDRFPTVDENYCRNPDNTATAWCYTTDPEVRWEYCSVPPCETYTVPIALSEVETLPKRQPLCGPEDRIPDEATSGLYFDGISNHVAITNSSSTELNLGGPFTIEVWVKPEEKTDFSTILSNKEATTGNPGFVFSINMYEDKSGRLMFEGAYSRFATVESVQWDVWQHIAVTYDGEETIFYISGEQIPHYPVHLYGPMDIRPTYLDAKIGEIARYFDGAVSTEHNSHFKGTMDELKIWNYARSPAEIRLSMDCESDVSAPGLIAYYRFDEENSTNFDDLSVYDSSPNQYHGVIVDDSARFEEDVGDFSQGYRRTQGVAMCAECSL